MKIIFMANIGNSDVYYNGQRVAESKQPRLAGQEILENWHSKKDKITIPIIEPALDDVRNSTSVLPGEIWLFCTNQPDTVAEAHRSKDTFHFAEIVKKKICEKYKYTSDCVKLITINGNPSNYDEMMDFYDRFFKETASDNRTGGRVFYFFSITGGTPQANTGLLVNSVNHFENYGQAVYVSEKAGALKLDLVSKVINKKYASLMIAMVENFDYSAALRIIKEWGKLPEHVEKLVLTAQYIYDLNFLDARAMLDQVQLKAPLDAATKIQLLNKIIPEVAALYEAQDYMAGYQRVKRGDKKELTGEELGRMKNSYELLLKFWLDKMSISWRNNNLYEFSDLLFGLVENIAKYMIMQIIAIPVLKPYFEDVKAKMITTEGFEEYAKEKKIFLGGEPNNFVFNAFLQHLNKRQKLGNEWARVVSAFIKPLMDIKNNRNEAVHLFGCSSTEHFKEPSLEKNFPGKNIVEVIRESFEKLGITPNETSLLEQINAWTKESVNMFSK